MKLIRTDLGVAVRLPTDIIAELAAYFTGLGLFDPARGALPLRHIIGIGRNYADHAKEQAAALPTRPMIFTKNPAAACLHGDDIRVPKLCQDPQTGGGGPGQVDWEAELAVVIGRPAKNVPAAEALSYVLGYCCANDVSARWWQKEGAGGQFCRGKSFDTFCPLGPALVPAAEVPDPQRLRVRCRVNSKPMQDASTADMIFPVATLISELSAGTTLLPGTVILTGTPGGVGMARTPPVFLRDGDAVAVEIEGVGVLENRVMFE